LKSIVIPTRGQVVATVPLPDKLPYNYLVEENEYMIQRKKDGRIIIGGYRRTIEGIAITN
jgi:glycine/D-amino acid oxidase-like deaminating enzyme